MCRNFIFVKKYFRIDILNNIPILDIDERPPISFP